MDTTVETKEDFIEAASNGLPRVADAIIAAPPKARIGVIDAVMMFPINNTCLSSECTRARNAFKP